MTTKMTLVGGDNPATTAHQAIPLVLSFARSAIRDSMRRMLRRAAAFVKVWLDASSTDTTA